MIRRNRDCARGERNMEEKGGKGGGRKANLHTLQTRANPWFTCLDRYSSSRALFRQGTSSGGPLFLLLLPVKIIPLSFLFPFYFFLKFTRLSMLVKTEGFSLGRGTRVKDGEIQKLQWALLKLSKQTEPVSAASDISWTYSLDLVDSLKPAGSPPVRFLRMCSSAWDAKESDGSRRNCESVTAEMKVLALCRRCKSFARCRPLWMCFKDLQT